MRLILSILFTFLLAAEVFAVDVSGYWLSRWATGSETEFVVQNGNSLTVYTQCCGVGVGIINGSAITLPTWGSQGVIGTDRIEWSGGVVWTRLPQPPTQCGPVTLSGAASAPSNIDGNNWVSLERSPYSFGSYPFPYVVPSGFSFYLTDILFQGKNIPGQRPSYFVVNGIFTATSDVGSVHFKTPLILPAGTRITGGVGNGTTDTSMNLIGIVSGVLVDNQDCWQKWK